METLIRDSSCAILVGSIPRRLIYQQVSRWVKGSNWSSQGSNLRGSQDTQPCFWPTDQLEFSRLIVFLISSPLKDKTDLEVISYSQMWMVKWIGFESYYHVNQFPHDRNLVQFYICIFNLFSRCPCKLLQKRWFSGTLLSIKFGSVSCLPASAS